MKSLLVRILVCIAMVASIGCHRMDVVEVASKLSVGMSKAELDSVMKSEKFLKEQTVQVWPGSNELQTRAAIRNNSSYKSIFPEDLIDERIPLDGSIKAYSYLIKEEQPFANPISVEALFVFVDEKTDRVIGWADIAGLVEVRLWHNFF